MESKETSELISSSDKIPERLDFSRIKNYRGNILAWSTYDLANTIYSMGVVSLTIAPLIIILAISSQAGINPSDIVKSDFKEVTEAQFDKGYSNGTLYFGIVLIIGNLIMAGISPLLGAFADQISKRKYLLSLVTIFCLIFTFAISYKLSLIWVLGVFLFANLAYQIGLVIYDSMLPFIAKPHDVSKVGGFGVAFGYFGSFVAIGIAFYMGAKEGEYFLSDKDDIFKIGLGYIPNYYPIVAFSFLLLGLPLLFVKEARAEKPHRSMKELYNETITALKTTAKEIYHYKDGRNFMIGWLLFVDTANTIIAFMSVIIVIGLGLSSEMVLAVLGIGIASAVLFTFPVGLLGDKIGPKKNFYVISILWLAAISVAIITNIKIGPVKTPEELAFLIGIIVGPALGGTWVAQRQMIAELAPVDRTSNYFGFANIFGRISSAIGPLVWWLSLNFFTKIIGLNSGIATRITIAVIAGILVIGVTFIAKVEDHHEDFLNGARHIGNGIWKDADGNVI